MPYIAQETSIQQQLNSITDTSNFMQFYAENLALFRQSIRDNYSTLAQRLNKGTGIAQSYSDTLSYMVLYGGFLYQCFDAITQKLFQEQEISIDANQPIHIVDYACGQGSASLVMIDRLITQHPQIKTLQITLIEPSIFSMQRAKQLITTKAQSYGLQLQLQCHTCTFDHLPSDFLGATAQTQLFHLFANILDLYAFGGFNLHTLVSKIKAISAQHILIAMSTKHPKSFASDGSLGFRELHRLMAPQHLLLANVLSIQNVSYYKHSYNYRCMVTEDKNMTVYASQWYGSN